MSPAKSNLINSISLIAMGLWGYVEVSSITALIPVIFGILLLICYVVSSNKPDLNKIVAHIAVLLTFIIILSLIGMRLPKSLDDGGLGLLRLLVMIGTSTLAIGLFVKSFIDVRRK